MRKFLKILALSVFLISVIPNNANAFITLDPTKGVGKVFKTVSDFSSDVQAKITDFQTKVMGSKFVSGVINEAKKAKAIYDQAMKVVDAIHSTYGQIVNSSEYLIAEKTARILRLNKEIKNIESQQGAQEAQKQIAETASTTQIDGKIAALQENNLIYQERKDEESLAILAENTRLIEELQKQSSEVQAQAQTKSDTFSQTNQQLESLKREKQMLEDEIKDLAKLSLVAFLSDVERMALAIDLNYVSEKETVTTEQIAKINSNRKKERNKVLHETYGKTVNFRYKLPKDIARTEELAANNDGMEAVTANIQGLTQVKTDNIRTLISYAELLILEMKAETAVEYSLLNVYQMSDQGKDMTTFRLEDYIFNYESYKAAQAKKRSITMGNIKGGVLDAFYKADRVIKGGQYKFDNFGNDLQSIVDETIDEAQTGQAYSRGSLNEFDKAVYGTTSTIDRGKNQINDLLNFGK